MTKENDSVFLSEEEVKKIRKPRTVESKVIEENQELRNTASYIKIEYSSNGRFWIPPILHFRELNTKEVSDLSTSTLDALLENLIVILNDCVMEDIKIEEMTPEEFLETLIALKLEYTIEHEHYFICEECSIDDYDLEEVKPSTFKLDLTTLEYVDIEEADENLKKYYNDVLKEFSKEEFKEYLISRHKDDPIDLDTWTLEKELETIIVQKEYSMPYDGRNYQFRWLKISDLVVSQKKMEERYKPKIKKVLKEKYPNMPVAEQKLIKKDKIDKIKEEQNKEIAYYTLSMSLEKIDSIPLNTQQKLNEYKLPQSISNSIGEYLKTSQFGLVDERDLVCNKCGHSQRRSLQHSITFIELLPINNSTKRKSTNNKRNVVLIGV